MVSNPTRPAFRAPPNGNYRMILDAATRNNHGKVPRDSITDVTDIPDAFQGTQLTIVLSLSHPSTLDPLMNKIICCSAVCVVLTKELVEYSSRVGRSHSVEEPISHFLFKLPVASCTLPKYLEDRATFPLVVGGFVYFPVEFWV